MRISILLLCMLIAKMGPAQNISNFIHVDQFGYLPSSGKVAVINNPQIGYNSASAYTPSDQLEVVNVLDGQVVWTGTPQPWKGGETHAQSGDQGWWLDFSELTQMGEYTIRDPLSGEQSATFRVSTAVYEDILKAAGRMFFYNRCNASKPSNLAGIWSDEMNFDKALQDTECRFIYDPANASLERDMSGGWFDAGDYNKYVTFTHSTLHNLLSAYEENPQAFGDDWNIPESGNGIPDLIDEIKWELDWLMKMVNEDGSVHIKMGSQNFDENTASPPSANTDQRFYGPTCSSASTTTASVLAHATKVFSAFSALSSYADQLGQMARTCWEYSRTFADNNSWETACDDGSIVAGDADQPEGTQLGQFLTAAIYLFEQEPSDSYGNYIKNRLGELEQLQTGFWGPYLTEMNDALMLYSRLPEADPATAETISSSFSATVQNDWENFFGFTEEDLYRARIPDWSYHWGSNQPKASYGLINALAIRMGVMPEGQLSYEQYMDGIIHYFHGVNPQGLVYLSNMYEFGAERSVNEIYHTWFADGTGYDHALNSLLGPAPGFLSGGPNPSFTVGSISPPSGQPLQKSYLDFNTSWPENSWEISEPAIYYQAAYVRLLANRVKANEVLSSGTGNLSGRSPIRIYPNPSQQVIGIESDTPIISLQVFSLAGKQVETKLTDTAQLDISSLASGVYLLKVNGSQTIKFVKP